MLNNFDIHDDGSVVLFVPLNDIADEWWQLNVAAGPMHGYGYAVECRYAAEIIAALWRHGEVASC